MVELRRRGKDVLASVIENDMMIDSYDPRYGMVEYGCFVRSIEFARDNALV